MRFSRKSAVTRLVAFPCSSVKANFEVRSMGDEEVQPSLCGGADFGDVDMEVADRVALELALYALAVFDVWQPRDAMPLKAAVERRAVRCAIVA